MSKYTFEKLGSDRFEQLVQALLEKQFRNSGNLVQFGTGADGAREATWTQAASHKTYIRPSNETTDVDKEWVFQAKFHDIGQRGWSSARADVESDLSGELEKIVNKYKVPCHKYILATNVPFSGVRNVGTRDKVNTVISDWRSEIPEIEVWDATDISRMLDADPETRTSFLGEILPGDILRELLKNQRRSDQARINAYRTYLMSLLRSEGDARAEEAGDEGGLKLEKVFVDLDLALNQTSANKCAMSFIQQVTDEHDHYTEEEADDNVKHLPNDLDCVPASFALLRANYKSILIKGGPGVGKSTLTQFLCLYHAARLVKPYLANKLAKRLKLRGGLTSDSLDAHCEIRFPLRIELRRYAKWAAEVQGKQENPHFAAYFAECINKESSSSFGMEDIFDLTAQNPVLLLLDGLDEVPQPGIREVIFKELQIFLDRCENEDCDVNVILSSRPQGYRGEFDGFEPLEWRVVDLSRENFDDYSNRWLRERIPNTDERSDAQQRVSDGMASHAVQLMAKTLLQATVMLTIAKRKLAIPHAKHKLYEKFVDVIFEREENKQPIIRKKAEELKHLHEKVGFELLCKMENEDDAQTLEGNEFRDCVERVILDYGRGNGTNISHNEIVDEIVVLAKDRLCLLAGKGDQQEDIDFVIQPFREYFAAAYLAHHEDADPHNTYSALVARQHVWANVLQFYVAFQSTAQQRNWISEADGSDLLGNDFESIIEVIRRRRALIRVLPEFVRPRNEYVRRAFQNLMNDSTRWAWRDRNSTASLLEAFAPNEAFHNLKINFGELSVSYEPNLFVELDLLIKTALTCDETKVIDLLSDLCRKQSTRAVAMAVSHKNNTPLNVDGISISELRHMLPDPFRSIRRQSRRFRFENWKGLSNFNVIELALTKSFRLSFNDPFKEDWINHLFDILRPRKNSFRFNHLEITFPNYFFAREDLEHVPLIKEKLKSATNSSTSRYLLALLDAIQQPADQAFYNKAKSEESKLDFEIESYFEVEHQLGLEPSAFDSEEAWIESRKSVFANDNKSISDFLSVLEGQFSWLILFVPFEGIKFLDPILTPSIHKELEGNIFNRIKKLSGHKSCPVEVISRLSAGTRGNAQLLNLITNLASNIGPSFLSKPQFKQCLLHSRLKLDNSDEVNELLTTLSAINYPSSFNSTILSACTSVDGIDANLLLEFWLKYCPDRYLPRVTKGEQLIEKLLKSGGTEAVKMAAIIMRSSNYHQRIRDSKLNLILTKQYCQMLCGSKDLTELDLSLLFSLEVSISEIELWSDPQTLKILQSSPYLLDGFPERLMNLANQYSSEHERIRQALGPIIEQRDEYAIEISLAVVDAILRLDELASTPLKTADWQS